MRRRTALLPLLAALLAPAAAAAQEGAPPSVLVVGDSLGVGVRPTLGSFLPGRELTFQVKSGRTTPQALAVLRQALRDADRAPAAVVVSSGSNDGSDPARFADRIHRVLAAIPASACVVWPNLVRPPRKGEEAGLNRVLLRAAAEDPRVVVVDWVRAVRTGRVHLKDGLHPDRAGYRTRAHMIANAVGAGCGAEEGGVTAPSGS